MSFVHLHLHTHYGQGDSTVTIRKLINKTKELGMPAVAVTDHCTLDGIRKFYDEACRQGVKLLPGCEVHITPPPGIGSTPPGEPFHLILLARNNAGCRNLLNLINNEYNKDKPSIILPGMDTLARYAGGLIALSGCCKGEIPRHLLNGDMKSARVAARKLSSLFEQDSFYLEIQNHGLPEQQDLNQAMARLSHLEGIPLVATNNVRYVDKNDSGASEILHCIRNRTEYREHDNQGPGSSEFYFKSTAEMQEAFVPYPEAVNNTLKIAAECNVQLEDPVTYIIPPPTGLMDTARENSQLRRLCLEGLNRRYDTITPELSRRLEYELNIIEETEGLPRLLLLIVDIVNFAREKGIIMPPGWSSACGSLALYCLGIHHIDPLRHGLQFELFIKPGLKTTPNIFLVTAKNRWDDILEFVRCRYGEDRVAYTGFLNDLLPKQVFREAGRLLNISPGELDRLSDFIFEYQYTYLTHNLNFYMEELPLHFPGDYSELLRVSSLLENLAYGESIHDDHGFGSVIISEEPLGNHHILKKIDGKPSASFLGIRQDNADGSLPVRMFNLELHYINLVEQIEETLRKLRQNGIEPDLNRIPPDDLKTLEKIHEVDMADVLLTDNEDYKGPLRELKPGGISDLAAFIALHRPGSFETLSTFIDSKNKRLPVKYDHPALEKHLCETYGFIIYREQLIQIIIEFSGFSPGKAITLIRVIGKNKADDLMVMEKEFQEGCITNGYDKATAARTFDLILRNSTYAFMKSHAVAVALLIYQSTYLKAHYPDY